MFVGCPFVFLISLVFQENGAIPKRDIAYFVSFGITQYLSGSEMSDARNNSINYTHGDRDGKFSST